MGAAFRPFAIALLAAAAMTGGCGRGPAPARGPATFEEAMAEASRQFQLNRWQEAFTACDIAFKHADRAGTTGVITATDCAAVAAARLGRPGLALPHHERLFAAHAERLRNASGRHRLANNFGVLLIEAGRRQEGIARLEWAMEAYAGTPYHIAAYGAFPARAMVVKNLARAWYETASDPAVRAWVQEQGTWLQEHMDRNRNGVNLSMGASSALDAVATIGRRQANTDTPAWEARVREWEPLEEGIAATNPGLAAACESVEIRGTVIAACMRELPPP
jgi:hypothetical protein